MNGRRGVLAGLAALGAAVAIACGGGADADDSPNGGSPPAATEAPSGSASPPEPPSSTATATPTGVVPRPVQDPLENIGIQPPDVRGQLLRESFLLQSLRREFPNLDLTLRTVRFSEILNSLPRDAIRAISQPQFDSVVAASEWLDDSEPVIALELNGDVRAYPLRILVWHELVNDEVGGVAVMVTYCPLCNTAITFERGVEGEVRTFGVSGKLRRNDLIMYDVESETLWQQITGEGIVGTAAGLQLSFLPSQIVSFGEFRASFPDAIVLNENTGSSISYGMNPYPLYDSDSSTFLPNEEFDDGRLSAKERVLTVELGGEPVAFPFSALSERIVIEAEAGGSTIVAFWQPGAVSPLDKEFIIGSRNVGSAGAFLPLLDGERLTFEAIEGEIFDTQTGSRWNVLGQAVEGALAGAQLEQVLSGNHFWFAWSIFEPETRVVTGSEGA